MADKYELKAILSAVDKMSPALKSISQVARSTRKYLLDVGSAAGSLSSKIGLPFAALSGVMGGFSLAGLKGSVTGFAEMSNAIKDGAVMTGMSTKQFQIWKYVADQSDISVETLTGAMGKLNKNIGEAASGKGKDLASLLHHLGIKTRDANGHLRSSIDILPQISDAFVRNQNPVVQARMGMALFGKTWQELMPLLTEGSDSFTASMARFKQLKGFISQEDLDAGDALNKKFKDLSFVTKGFGYAIAKELIPTISPLVEDFIQWAAANKKVISTNVKEVVRDLVANLKSFDWKGLIEDIKGMAAGFGKVVDMVGGAKNALIGLAIFMNATAITATLSLVGSLMRLVWWLGASALGLDVVKGKVILTGGWIAATNTMLVGSFNWLKMQAAAAYLVIAAEGPLGAAKIMLTSLASTISGVVVTAFGVLRTAIMAVGRALFMTPLGIILSIATAAFLIYENWDTLKKWFGEFFNWLDEKWQKFIGWIADAAKATKDFFGGNDSVMTVAMQKQVTPATGNAPWSPLKAQNSRVGGAIDINFNNAPPGMRVGQNSASGPIDFNLSAGYRSQALGMP